MGIKWLEKHDSALFYLKKSAEYENNIAEYVLGRMYEFLESYRDYKEAGLWYELAARHGNKMAGEAMERVSIKSKKYAFVPNFIINYFDYYSND